MEKRKTRSSNIELLRSVAMLMIISYHIVYHCVNIQLTDKSSIERMGNGLFNNPVFYRKLVLLDMLDTFGIIGNVIFILISGYFMVQKGKNIDIVKISKKLLCQLGFASVILTIVPTVCVHIRRVGGGNSFFNLINIQVFNSMSWFAGYYYAVILIAYLFLNSFLERIDNKRYISFLTIIFAFTQLGWTGALADGLVTNLRTLLTGIFLYALGGYLRKYDPLGKLRTYVFFLIIIITYFFVSLSAYNNTENKIESYIQSKTGDDFIQSVSGFSNCSIIVIIIGVCLFELFTRINISQSKFLNYLGQATFMVYLLHDNGFFYSIWNTQDWITLLYNHPCKFVSKIFIWSCGVFIFGVITYTIYIILAKLFNKYKWILFKKGKI